MIKTFDTIKEARERFNELKERASESFGEREFSLYYEFMNDGFKMDYARCGCNIIVSCRAERISRLETLDKIKRLFDEVMK